MNSPLFLIGAGFNADAANGEYRYPLARDLPGICGFPAPSGNKSIEEAFADALRNDPYEPMEKLEHALMMADYGLAHPLASQGPNCYRRFFQTYAASHFLTFNYDSLAEIILFALRRWYPHDGYGVPVTTDLGWEEDVPGELKTGRSSSLVLHLHGSFSLYTSDHKAQQGLMVERIPPLFYFVPNFPIRYHTTPPGALAGEQQIVARLSPIRRPNWCGPLSRESTGGWPNSRPVVTPWSRLGIASAPMMGPPMAPSSAPLPGTETGS